MGILPVPVFGDRPHLEVVCSQREPRWYAAYVSANHEKTVARQLELRSLEAFLPLYEKLSCRKDRHVRLQMPLFPGYVFVRIDLAEKLRVLEIPGVARLVGFNGRPTPLNGEEIEGLRSGFLRSMRGEPWPYPLIGRRVRLKNGPLQGLEGILIRKRTAYRFVLSLELIQRAMAVEVDAVDVEPIH